MTNADLCPVCARELGEHESGIPCCPYCKSDNWINYSVVYKCKTCGSETPPQNDGRNDDHVDWVTREHAKEAACTRAYPPPWLNAPIPEEGETQTLFVIADGTWNIAVPNKGYYKGFDSDEWTEIACGFNSCPAGKWTRTMRDGKLVYEEVKG